MKIIFAIAILIILSSVMFLSGCRQQADIIISAEPIRSCETDSDCIIADSLKCDCNCKEAIAKEDLDFWNAQIALHADDDCEFECGACDDNEVTEARCVENVCEKVYPDYVPDERVYGMPVDDNYSQPLLPPIGNSSIQENKNPPEGATIPSLPSLPVSGGG